MFNKLRDDAARLHHLLQEKSRPRNRAACISSFRALLPYETVIYPVGVDPIPRDRPCRVVATRKGALARGLDTKRRDGACGRSHEAMRHTT
jgi:hypothetical protein